MLRFALSFSLGVLVATVVAVIGLLVATMALDSSGAGPVDLHLGALSVYAFDRSAAGMSSRFGPGMLLVLGAAGLVNAVAATLMAPGVQEVERP